MLADIHDREADERGTIRDRLKKLADQAVDLYEQIVIGNIEASPTTRLNAANSIMDRAGFPRGVELHTDTAVLTSKVMDQLTLRALELNLIPPPAGMEQLSE